MYSMYYVVFWLTLYNKLLICIDKYTPISILTLSIPRTDTKFLVYKTNILTSNIRVNNNKFLSLILHVSAELRHFHGIYTPIFKTIK